MYYTYILVSEKTGRHYYGHSNHPLERLKQHNAGKVRSTKSYRPWRILYTKKFSSKSEAYKREFFFKSIEGYKWLRDNGIIKS